MAGQESLPRKADPLNLAALHLCNISYATDIVRIPGLVLGTPPLFEGGIWTCLWGPVQSADQANLAFVAGYSPQPGLPVQTICVTIRGTDIDVHDIWGILAQVWEDIDGTSQTCLPWDGWSSSALIAQGTWDGLTSLMALTEQKVNLDTFLRRFLNTPAHSDVTTVVTGHSLGACLATVVAPWIESFRPSSYKGDIQPITFAGPTAGNAEFATQYGRKFPKARRFYNTLDIIPKALANLPEMLSIYSRGGLDAPELVWILLVGMSSVLLAKGVTYQQPAQGAQELTGQFYDKDTDWYAEALHQHHPATYKALLTGKPVDVSALPKSITRLRTKPPLKNDIQRFLNALAHAAEVKRS